MHITSRDMVSRLQGEVADKAKLERILKIEAKESEVKVRFVLSGFSLLLCLITTNVLHRFTYDTNVNQCVLSG